MSVSVCLSVGIHTYLNIHIMYVCLSIWMYGCMDGWTDVRSGVATGGAGGQLPPPPGSGKWKIRKFAIWGKMTPNYSAVLDFDYQLRRHELLPSNNYSQSPTKQLNKSGST